MNEKNARRIENKLLLTKNIYDTWEVARDAKGKDLGPSAGQRYLIAFDVYVDALHRTWPMLNYKDVRKIATKGNDFEQLLLGLSALYDKRKLRKNTKE